MAVIDSLFNPRHRRACTYKAVKPYLSKPMPAIVLKHFKTPTESERARMARETDLVCAQCGQKVAVLGSTNIQTGEVYCDSCAIDNYRIHEGFKTRKAAEAHRRRMFDATYLLTEVLFDKYLVLHGLKSDELLTDAEKQTLFEISYELDSLVPKPKKIELRNTLDQTKIERYYNRLIDQWVTIPKVRIG